MTRYTLSVIFASVVGAWGVIAGALLRAGRLQPGFWGQSPLGVLCCGLGLALFAWPVDGDAAGGLAKVGGAFMFGAGVVLESRARKRRG